MWNFERDPFNAFQFFALHLPCTQRSVVKSVAALRALLARHHGELKLFRASARLPGMPERMLKGADNADYLNPPLSEAEFTEANTLDADGRPVGAILRDPNENYVSAIVKLEAQMK